MPLIVLMFFAGCARKHNETDQHEAAVKRTVWTQKSELFVEYSEAKVGEPCRFLLHLTYLETFKPVTIGLLTLTFTPKSGEPFTVTIKNPAKPGIFTAETIFKNPGRYAMKVVLAGKNFSDEILVDGIEVRGVNEKVRNLPVAEEKEGHLISFSKEQQWRIDFKIAKPARKTVSTAFVVAGELIPVSNNEVTVSAPLAGILSVSKRLPYIGQKIDKDEVVALIEPAPHRQDGFGQLSAEYAESKNRVALAQKEYDRAKRLYEAKAAPRKRIEEAELALDSAKAALDPLERAMEIMRKGTSENRIMVRSPLKGTLVELPVSNGKAVEAGQPLMRIINTSILWLRANLPVTEIGRLKSFHEAAFTVAGINGEFKPKRLVAINDLVDAKSRTVPVVFEVNNPTGALKAGMFADVSVQTGHVEKALVLPEEALFEDEGRFFAFVQREGESFERREVKVGTRGNGYAHIREGLGEDERVVTKGGYYVKLASLSSRIQQGHGHEH
jgi:RND family efflux transporter MFP subunit